VTSKGGKGIKVSTRVASLSQPSHKSKSKNKTKPLPYIEKTKKLRAWLAGWLALERKSEREEKRREGQIESERERESQRGIIFFFFLFSFLQFSVFSAIQLFFFFCYAESCNFGSDLKACFGLISVSSHLSLPLPYLTPSLPFPLHNLTIQSISIFLFDWFS
jgi:hypothetical protein